MIAAVLVLVVFFTVFAPIVRQVLTDLRRDSDRS
jgi:hypothetical protein